MQVSLQFRTQRRLLILINKPKINIHKYFEVLAIQNYHFIDISTLTQRIDLALLNGAILTAEATQLRMMRILQCSVNFKGLCRAPVVCFRTLFRLPHGVSGQLVSQSRFEPYTSLIQVRRINVQLISQSY
jgi:hypothetical protein